MGEGQIWIMRPVVSGAIALCAAAGLLTGTPAVAAVSCATAQGELARVQAIDERAEPVLADGRIVLLPDIEIPRDDGSGLRASARNLLLERLAGKEVRVAPIEAEPDRWGRTVARLYARASARSEQWAWIEEQLVEKGLARVAPQFDSPACDALLLASEARARAAATGLWRDPFYSVLPVGRASDLSAHVGERVIVEGAIVSLGEAGGLIYFNFGADRRSDLALVASKSRRKELTAEGAPLAAFVGRFVRARGDLELRFEPRIEIHSAAQIETVNPIDPPSLSAPAKQE